MSDEQQGPDDAGSSEPRRLDPLKAAREAAERAAAERAAAERAEASGAPPPAPEPEPEPELEPAPEPPPAARRVDPDRNVFAKTGRLGPTGRPITPVIDTRKYQRRVAYIGIALVLLLSAFLFIENGVTTPGVGRGGYLHKFVAPLATSRITKPANANPNCNPAKPNPKGLNMCDRRPIVLTFFVTGDGDCVNEVNALQKIAPEFKGITFAAVAVSGNVSSTLPLVRSHHWTIPVGTDPDGRVGELYGVEFCPMVEIARAGGLVEQRLIGDTWNNAAKLAAEVRKYLGT